MLICDYIPGTLLGVEDMTVNKRNKHLLSSCIKGIGTRRDKADHVESSQNSTSSSYTQPYLHNTQKVHEKNINTPVIPGNQPSPG